MGLGLLPTWLYGFMIHCQAMGEHLATLKDPEFFNLVQQITEDKHRAVDIMLGKAGDYGPSLLRVPSSIASLIIPLELGASANLG
ncbi:hypothetical protein SRHO_G00293890 [Serrasalmus rhombeus]